MLTIWIISVLVGFAIAIWGVWPAFEDINLDGWGMPRIILTVIGALVFTVFVPFFGQIVPLFYPNVRTHLTDAWERFGYWFARTKLYGWWIKTAAFKAWDETHWDDVKSFMNWLNKRHGASIMLVVKHADPDRAWEIASRLAEASGCRADTYSGYQEKLLAAFRSDVLEPKIKLLNVDHSVELKRLELQLSVQHAQDLAAQRKTLEKARDRALDELREELGQGTITAVNNAVAQRTQQLNVGFADRMAEALAVLEAAIRAEYAGWIKPEPAIETVPSEPSAADVLVTEIATLPGTSEVTTSASAQAATETLKSAEELLLERVQALEKRLRTRPSHRKTRKSTKRRVTRKPIRRASTKKGGKKHTGGKSAKKNGKNKKASRRRNKR